MRYRSEYILFCGVRLPPGSHCLGNLCLSLSLRRSGRGVGVFGGGHGAHSGVFLKGAAIGKRSKWAPTDF